MTSEQIVAEIRRLAGNLDGTRDGRYDEFDLGLDVLQLLRKEFGCVFCGGDVAEGRGVRYAESLYHREGCLPADLECCSQCGDAEDRRRVAGGICERCRSAEKENPAA